MLCQPCWKEGSGEDVETTVITAGPPIAIVFF